jgi:hypothetical protein
MHSQLNYIIAKQHHAELAQNAERARLIAAANTRRPERQPSAALRSFRGRIIAAAVHVTPRATHDAL